MTNYKLEWWVGIIAALVAMNVVLLDALVPRIAETIINMICFGLVVGGIAAFLCVMLRYTDS